MKLRHVKIERFRCVESLAWRIDGDFLCLIGPGDAGKSTLLDAVEFALSPRWNVAFDDSDFYRGDTEQPIVIEATLGELPPRLLSDASFGLRLRGFTTDGAVVDEPGEGDEEVITIRLTVDASLEPTWEVVTDRHPEGLPIHAREREKLGAVRLGAMFDRHLSWGKGSFLARLTDDETSPAALLAAAGRTAREAVNPGQLGRLQEAATRTAALAEAFGVKPSGTFLPGLDPGLTTPGAGGLALHDGPVPLRRSGLGTRRLTLLAVQREIASTGGVVLIDELEHGLEPYRVRRLLRELLNPTVTKPSGVAPTSTASATVARQVFVTSHSPIALSEIEADQLRVVRRDGTGIRVLRPTNEAQPTMRSAAEAFLSRRVIVCEGKTELGLIRGLDQFWSRTGEPMAARGIGLADAGGRTKVGKTARAFLGLAYPTAILADSDQDLDEPDDDLRAAGAAVFRWAGTHATEDQIIKDLPWAGVAGLVRVAIDEHGADLVMSQIATGLNVAPSALSNDTTDWIPSYAESTLRTVIASAARSKNAWFKRVDLAEPVGVIVGEHLHAISTSDLAVKINALRSWILARD